MHCVVGRFHLGHPSSISNAFGSGLTPTSKSGNLINNFHGKVIPLLEEKRACFLLRIIIEEIIQRKAMDNNSIESTNRLLKVIIGVLLRGKDEAPLTLRQRIEILSDLGLKPAEIAEILGRTNTYVNKELSGIRKGRKK
jgi:hypothetical protein